MILETGASYERQRKVAADNGGDVRAVVDSLLAEMRTGHPGSAVMTDDPAAGFLASHEAELIAFRRDLHRHPELGRGEQRTTATVAAALHAAGLSPQLLPVSGLWCDIGDATGDPAGPTVLLRADLDALAAGGSQGRRVPLGEPGGVPRLRS